MLSTATKKLMSEADIQLLLETQPRRLKGLDEDDLLALHDRVRRARNKYTKLYRRKGASTVGKDAARGHASKKNRANRDRAEVFEDALSRVSTRLAKVAAESAAALKADRLARAKGGTSAKGGKSAGDRSAKGGTAGASRSQRRSRKRSAIDKKVHASTKSKGKARQARRDSR